MTSASTLGEGGNPFSMLFQRTSFELRLWISQNPLLPWWHFIIAIHFSHAITIAISTPQQATAVGRDERSQPASVALSITSGSFFHLPGNFKHPIIFATHPRASQGLKSIWAWLTQLTSYHINLPHVKGSKNHQPNCHSLTDSSNTY